MDDQEQDTAPLVRRRVIDACELLPHKPKRRGVTCVICRRPTEKLEGKTSCCSAVCRRALKGKR